MIRYLLLFFLGMLVYYSVKTVLGIAAGSGKGRERPNRLEGQDMVLDPECNTYIVKDRAVVRRSGGGVTYFCSESCARKHEEKSRA